MSGGGNAADRSPYVVRDQRFEFKLAGLKPNTRHYFYFEGADLSAKCQMLNGKIGAGLFTDLEGKMDFFFYYQSGISASNNLKTELSLYSKIAGVKKILVKSSDAVSYAETTITFASLNSSTTLALNTNKPISTVLSTL